MTDQELRELLRNSEGTGTRRGVEEILAQLEWAYVTEAVNGNDDDKVRSMTKLEGLREVGAQIVEWSRKQD